MLLKVIKVSLIILFVSLIDSILNLFLIYIFKIHIEAYNISFFRYLYNFKWLIFLASLLYVGLTGVIYLSIIRRKNKNTFFGKNLISIIIMFLLYIFLHIIAKFGYNFSYYGFFELIKLLFSAWLSSKMINTKSAAKKAM